MKHHSGIESDLTYSVLGQVLQDLSEIFFQEHITAGNFNKIPFGGHHLRGD